MFLVKIIFLLISVSLGVEAQCGGVLEQSNGTLQSPNYPSYYLNNATCIWKIIVEPGSQVALTFRAFEVEGVIGNCDGDFLEIRDGPELDSPVLARLCGSELPDGEMSSSNTMLVRFVSNSSVVKKGFSAKFVSAQCGGVLEQPKGTLQSPNYPNLYLNNVMCIWKIIVEPKSKVALTFQDFKVDDAGGNCDRDFLEIRNGPELESPLLKRICGSYSPNGVISSSNTMFVRFVSDSFGVRKGFLANFVSVQCGGVLEQPNGTLQSPNYPNYYLNNAMCIWKIIVEPKRKVALTFRNMKVENSDNCASDFIEVRNGAELDSPLLARFCGSYIPESVMSSYNTMFVRFVSDFSSVHYGFLANFLSVECGGVLEQPKGTLESPNFPGRYLNNAMCIWKIIVEPESQVALTFQAFEVEQDNNCGSDFVEIRNGPELDSPLLARLCGSKLPKEVRSSSNTMFVRFVSDHSAVKSGFSANFVSACRKGQFACQSQDRCIPTVKACDGIISCPDGSDEKDCPVCGGVLEQPKGTLQSINYPAKYLNNTRCIWKIIVDPESHVVLTFQTFEVENSNNCVNDFVEIRNGPELDSPLLARFCGSELPEEVRSSSNTMFVRFVSDQSVVKKGFSANFVSACRDDQFQCKSQDRCIPKVRVCDGFISCPDGSDENYCLCSPLLLKNGSVERQIEIGRHRTSNQCWNFVLNENEQLTVNMESTLYPRECKFGNISLFIDGSYYFVGENKTQDSVLTICPLDKNRKTLTFINNVQIRFTSYFPFDGDGMDVIKFTYSKINRGCLRSEMILCSEISCVSKEKLCDGVKDCENGFDEDNCGFVALSAEFFENSRKNAARWVRSQGDADWRRKENTARAVVALYLSNDLNLSTSSNEHELEKQLEQEISTGLRNKIEKASISEMATYINALQTICYNPRNFNGIDLVQQLKQEMEETPNNVTPFSYLTLCNVKETVSKEVTDSLVEILDKQSDFGFALEIQALASMALTCISNNDQYKHLKQKLTDHLNKMKEEQKQDGSFGNEYTTALVIQALIANSQANDRDWKFKAVAEYLKKTQKFDGSFGDFLTTYLVMPVLNGKSLVDLGQVNCTDSQKRPREGNPVSDIKYKHGEKIPVNYSLLIGDEKDHMLPVILRTPENITVLELMTLAADIDPKYKFKTHQIKGKTYVYEISSIPNDPEKNKFWFLYQQVGNDMKPALKQSPNEVYVGKNYNIVMWYKTLTQWHGHSGSNFP